MFKINAKVVFHEYTGRLLAEFVDESFGRSTVFCVGFTTAASSGNKEDYGLHNVEDLRINDFRLSARIMGGTSPASVHMHTEYLQSHFVE